MGQDEEIMRFITSVNIATGFHAGDPDHMATSVSMAESLGVGIGAHPAYPDLQGFGRRELRLTPKEIRNCIKYQAGALSAFVAGRKLQHVKPHGALYNRAAAEEDVADAVVSSIGEFDPEMIHVVLSGSVWEKVAARKGVLYARECFADRAVLPDGRLVPRNMPGAVIDEPEAVVQRALEIVVDGKTSAQDGTVVEVQADTLCLHGDSPSAVRVSALLRKAMEDEGIEVLNMRAIVRMRG